MDRFRIFMSTLTEEQYDITDRYFSNLVDGCIKKEEGDLTFRLVKKDGRVQKLCMINDSYGTQVLIKIENFEEFVKEVNRFFSHMNEYLKERKVNFPFCFTVDALEEYNRCEFMDWNCKMASDGYEYIDFENYGAPYIR